MPVTATCQWYERPHDGAHEMEVMAYGAVTSSIKDPNSTGGEGSSERSVIGRREGDSCIIYDTPFQPFVKREITGRRYLHNARHAAVACRSQAPPPSIPPCTTRPTTHRRPRGFLRPAKQEAVAVAAAARSRRAKRLQPGFRISELG